MLVFIVMDPTTALGKHLRISSGAGEVSKAGLDAEEMSVNPDKAAVASESRTGRQFQRFLSVDAFPMS